MEPISVGDRVRVLGPGPEVDGIVFDLPSATKVVVAAMDPKRGPKFRTVNPATLAGRDADGPHDRALKLLVRRTPVPNHGAARGDNSGERGRSGFQRETMHRTTGK